MHYKDWPSLLRRIPAEYHEGLLVATITGAEIVIQSIIHLDEQFLVVRGRPAGSSDSGKTIMLSLANVNYVLFQQVLAEETAQALFSGETPNFAALPTPADSNGEASEGAPEEPSANRPGAPQGERNGTAPKNEPAPNLGNPAKSALLAKLKARLQGDG